MTWISWSFICKPKTHGGIGIKNIGVFNIALLPKWLWRFIKEPSALWKTFLEARYDSLKSKVMLKKELRDSKSYSLWWRDIMRVGDVMEEKGFTRKVSCKLGEGKFVSFGTLVGLGNYLSCALI
ncbi:unnamed protein product [Lathyrus sativus]|nr:unnamed protein product [Lathyrus sativus]